MTDGSVSGRWDVPPECAGDRLDVFLRGRLGIGRRRLKRLFDSAAVTVNGRPAKPGLKLEAADRVEVRPGDNVTGAGPRRGKKVLVHLPGGRPVPLLYESAAAWVADKPAGVVVLGGGRAADRGFRAALDELTGTPPGGDREWSFLHRLDRDTSGCLLIARTREAAAALRSAFENGEVHKEYLLVCSGRIKSDEGTIDLPLSRVEKPSGPGDVRLRTAVDAA